jgi:hypothetical protein
VLGTKNEMIFEIFTFFLIAESEKLDTLVEEKEKNHLSPKSPIAVQPPVKIDVCDTVVSSGSVKCKLKKKVMSHLTYHNLFFLQCNTLAIVESK